VVHVVRDDACVIGEPGVSTDEIVRGLLAGSALRFTVVDDPAARRLAFALRGDAVLEGGWGIGDRDGLDRDADDDGAVIVVGWRGDVAVATGRIVLPPGPLPTEVECGITVQPAGHVVDVGRMVVAPAERGWHGATFVGLLAALYVEMRRHGHRVATGMMSRDVRGLVRLLGVQLEVLGPDRASNGALRCPVRFSCDDQVETLAVRWSVDAPDLRRPRG
jgi:hypothetical protein